MRSLLVVSLLLVGCHARYKGDCVTGSELGKCVDPVECRSVQTDLGISGHSSPKCPNNLKCCPLDKVTVHPPAQPPMQPPAPTPAAASSPCCTGNKKECFICNLKKYGD